jgi:hypothetical protein
VYHVTEAFILLQVQYCFTLECHLAEYKKQYCIHGAVQQALMLLHLGFVLCLNEVQYLTLSLLMSYIYGALSKARNLMYIYGRDFLLGILLLEPCILLIGA